MKIVVLILVLFSFSALSWAQSNIAEARVMAIGTSVTVTGIVINGSELGNIRYIQDNTAGIGIYSSTNSTLLSAIRGDEITVTGILKNYNSLLELDPLTSVILNSQGNSLPSPQIVTPPGISESTEGELTQVNHAMIQGAGNFVANTNYTFNSGGVNSQLRIVSTCPLVGQTIPAGIVNLIGVTSQYSFTGTGGYQLLIRDANDIIPVSGIYIMSPLMMSNLSTSGMTISWITNISGTTQAFYGKTITLELGLLSGTGGSTDHSVNISGANPSEIYYVKAFSVANGDTAFSATRIFITSSVSSGEMKVYFSKTTDHTVSTGTDAITLEPLIDDTLINYINRTRYTLDIAIYNFSTTNMDDITGAINNAYNRGVMVRVVYEGSAGNTGLDNLNSSIGKIARPSTSGIMHNKFVIIDAYSSNPNDAVVWTGSTNWTTNQLNTDANNVIIIQDQSLAKSYQLEFEEMFGSTGNQPNSANAKFGSAKTDNTPHEFIIGGNRVEMYFSPSDSVNSKILNTINNADNELYVETNLITKSDIGYKIQDKSNSGVITKVIVSNSGVCSATVVSTLTTALGNNFREYIEGGILHHKLMIADPNFISSDPLVLTGSHNWSASADEQNDENSLVVHNATIANIYYQEFVKRFGLGQIILTAGDLQFHYPVEIYPNPNQGSFYFQNLPEANKECTLTIFDITGRKLFTQNFVAGVKSQEHMIVSPVTTKGIYFVEISSEYFKQIYNMFIE